MKLYRERLDRMKAVRSIDLERCRSGKKVLIAGYRICLQMPPTAKGFAFITLEDEEGLINVVVRPDKYHAHRMLIRLEPLLLVEGIVEKKEGLIKREGREICPPGARPESKSTRLKDEKDKAKKNFSPLFFDSTG